MKVIGQTRKIISYLLKILVIVSAIVGTILSAFAGKGAFMGGTRIFMYFTIQSNIAIAFICAVGLFMLRRDKDISDL